MVTKLKWAPFQVNLLKIYVKLLQFLDTTTITVLILFSLWLLPAYSAYGTGSKAALHLEKKIGVTISFLSYLLPPTRHINFTIFYNRPSISAMGLIQLPPFPRAAFCFFKKQKAKAIKEQGGKKDSLYLFKKAKW